MPDISEKRIRKSFPGVKERREGGRESGGEGYSVEVTVEIP